MTRARSRQWVVGDSDPRTLGEALHQWGEAREAAAQGRVFVDRKRATVDTRLTPGALVELHPAPDRVATSAVSILAQRGGIVAVDKPSGVPTIPDQRGTGASAIAAVASLLGIGEPSRVHTSSRLDADVSGVLLAATTPDARAALKAAREAGHYQRHYVALATKAPIPPQGSVDEPIGRARDGRARSIRGAEAVASLTHYASIAAAGQYAMIAAEPVTGRTHQIRVHLAHVGAPLIGDALYGARKTVVTGSGAVRDPKRIALHAAWVSVRLGEQAEPWIVRSPLPPELLSLWRELGGSDDAWQLALESLDHGGA